MRIDDDHSIICSIVSRTIPEGEFWSVRVDHEESQVVVVLNAPSKQLEAALEAYIRAKRARIEIDPDISVVV